MSAGALANMEGNFCTGQDLNGINFRVLIFSRTMSINQTLSLKYIEKAFSATFNFNGQVGGIEDTSNLDVIKKI